MYFSKNTGQIETKLCRNVTWVVNNIFDFRFIGRINNADIPFVLWLDCLLYIRNGCHHGKEVSTRHYWEMKKLFISDAL